MKKQDRFDRLLSFIQRLEEANIAFSLKRNRDDAVSIEAFAPGERWEIDFVDDGSVDVERFRSIGGVGDESVLEELFALNSDDDVPAKARRNSRDNGALARK